MPSAAEVPLHVSALARRVRLTEAAAGAMSLTDLLHPGEGSLVATRGSERIYLTETVGDRLCIVQVDESTGGAGTNCQPRSNLLTTGIVLVSHPLVDSGPTSLVVVVPDGYTRAVSGDSRAAVASNVAVLELTSPQETLTVSGVGPGRCLHIDLHSHKIEKLVC